VNATPPPSGSRAGTPSGASAASPIEQAIRAAPTRRGRGAFVPFLTAGHPSPAATVELALALAELGADVLEIGIPFSDPLADGPVIQRSSQQALDAGMTPAGALELVASITAACEVPVVLMTYLNPIEHLAGGLAAAARQAGVAGLLVTDLPFDQGDPLWQEIAAAEIDPILLVSPTTPLERARALAARGRGFLYCVTRMGVTGGGEVETAAIAARVAAIHEVSRLPVLLGFGIATADDAEHLGRLADGVVVGSALVTCAADPEDPLGAVTRRAREIVGGLERGFEAARSHG
jgi:tryptophan synthase alpha chain